MVGKFLEGLPSIVVNCFKKQIKTFCLVGCRAAAVNCIAFVIKIEKFRG